MAQQNKVLRHKGIWFSISIENNEYVAFISADALTSHFSAAASPSGYLAAYLSNQARIDAVAEAKFLAGAQRPIKLSILDFIPRGADSTDYAGLMYSALNESSNLISVSESSPSQINLRRYQ